MIEGLRAARFGYAYYRQRRCGERAGHGSSFGIGRSAPDGSGPAAPAHPSTERMIIAAVAADVMERTGCYVPVPAVRLAAGIAIPRQKEPL
ncbi:hypothetical protein Cs7R123_59850 [Catellatospora sp. TT07R-123]|nr:hypothetical protein Cs7R123_59850 [Catellatospora sp. TT07R-123]